MLTTSAYDLLSKRLAIHHRALFLLLCVSFFLFALISAPPATAKTEHQAIHIALDDLPGIDMLNILIAIERARARGLNIKVSYLQSEGIAVQTVLNGQADIGMGTPYALIQSSQAPLRMFYQLNILRFHPVVNIHYYQGWEDLDGVEMYTHGKGSGTEAVMQMMAKRHGITFGKMYYLPGSGVRARAMLRERIKATVVDTERRNILLQDRRFALLPMPELHASDEALYAHQDFLITHRAELKILVEELLRTWRAINADPEYVLRAHRHYQLLPHLNPEAIASILPFYQEMVAVKAYPNDGGGETAVKADFDFYSFAGTLQGEAATLKMSDFWSLELLTEALDSLEPTQ